MSRPARPNAFVLVAVVLATSACGYAPSPGNGMQTCAPSGKPCPDGFYCASDKTCWRDGQSPSGTAAAMGGTGVPGAQNGGAGMTPGLTDAGATGAGGTTGMGGNPTTPDAAGSGAAGPLDLAAALRRNLAVQCAKWKECRPTSFSSRFPDVETCVEYEGAELLIYLALPGTSLDAAGIEACTEKALKGYTCDQFDNDGPACPMPPDPWPPAGKFESGQTCLEDTQCKSLNCRRIGSGAECGVCVARVPGGGDCENNSCELSFSCTRNNICRPRGQPGQSCGPAEGTCVSNTTCVNGFCRRYSARGESCADSAICQGDLFCNSLTKVCDLRSPPKGAGESCASVPSGEFVACIAGTSCVNGVCVRNLGPGAACSSTSSGPVCERNLECNAGRCGPFVIPACAKAGN